MAQADFSHGAPLMVDYTSGSAVSAGDVVVVTDIPYIAHRDIAADIKGALAAGGGVYRVTTDGSTDAGGTKIYWDDTANKVTTTSTSNKVFGYTVPDQAATTDGDKIFVVHQPDS